MRRCIPIPVVLVLVGAIAGTATLTYATLTPASVQPEPIGAQTEGARTFYTAVDAMLQTGESDGLEQVVPPDFVDHAFAGGTGRDGLIRSIRDLRRRFPAFRLTVTDLYQTPDRAVALIDVTGANGEDLLGIDASGGMTTWAPVEMLRIEGGQVLERWSVAAPGVRAEPFFAARVAPPVLPATASDRVPVLSLRVDRLSIEAGAALSGADRIASVVYVETGTIESTVDGEAVLFRASERDREGALVADGGEVLLAPGDALTVPASVWRRLRATGGAPASVLVVRLGSAAFPETIPADQPDRAVAAADIATPGVAGDTLVDVHPDVPVGSDPVAVEDGRLTLAPGTFVTGVGTRPLTVVIVERGTLTTERNGERHTFDAGTAATVLAGDSAILRNSGAEPLSVLVLTIDADRSPAAPS
jgi:quercetin dioxygenase-like cupin family protein